MVMVDETEGRSRPCYADGASARAAPRQGIVRLDSASSLPPASARSR
jgi:hypothetical protein